MRGIDEQNCAVCAFNIFGAKKSITKYAIPGVMWPILDLKIKDGHQKLLIFIIS